MLPKVMSLASFIDKLDKADTPDHILGSLQRYLAGFGVQRLICLYIPPEGLFDFQKVELYHYGYDDFPELINIFEKGLDSNHTVTRAGLRSYENLDPHYRGDVTYNGIFEELSQKVLNLLKERDLKPGLAVTTYGPKERSSIFDIALPSGTRGSDLFPTELSSRHIQIACQAAHLRICETKRSECLHDIRLTNREKEVLSGVVEGQKNSEIAHNMNLSKHTVDSYLRRIFLKLMVTDRVEAAVKCVELKLLIESKPNKVPNKVKR